MHKALVEGPLRDGCRLRLEDADQRDDVATGFGFLAKRDIDPVFEERFAVPVVRSFGQDGAQIDAVLPVQIRGLELYRQATLLTEMLAL
jgi:hypothetical protein